MASNTSPARSPGPDPTEDVEQMVITKTHKHARFWFEDGNIVLIADDGLLFRLHRGILSLHSEVFRSMFAFPSRMEDNEVFEECPIVRLQDRGEDLALFFSLLYDGGKDPFFQRKGEVGFHLVRAMLILSFKYDVQHIREEALHRLHVWYPKTLAGWDTLRAGQLAEDLKFFVSESDNIAVINLAHKFNLPELLPAAYYACSCLPLIELTRGADYGSGVELLSWQDLAKVLMGLDALDALIQPRLDIFLRLAAGSTCQYRSVCEPVLHQLVPEINISTDVFTRKWTVDCIDGVVGAAIEELSIGNRYTLCALCKRALFEKCEEQRKIAWDKLGGIYGVQPWPIGESDSDTQ